MSNRYIFQEKIIMPKDESPADIVQIIDDYLNGRLNDSQTDDLWIRLMEHPEYYSLLETRAAMKKIDPVALRKKIERKGHSSPDDDDEPSGNRVYERKTPWIAALAAALILAVFLNLFRSSVETEIRPPVSEIHSAHLFTPDISRSAADTATELELRLQRAYLLSVSGNYADAIAEYGELLDTSGLMQNRINYNLGIVLYNSGDFSASANRFLEVDCLELADPLRTESCYWFTANSLVASGDFDHARHFAEKILENGAFYHNDAIELLKKIRYRQDQNE